VARRHGLAYEGFSSEKYGKRMSDSTKSEVMAGPRWLNINQLMQILPLKKSRIYYLTHIAAIPHHKVGQTLLFREDEILEWMQRNKVA
jgi:predicted DNA-binding transcriptional regulator AlpA